jgi:hypothetical protein
MGLTARCPFCTSNLPFRRDRRGGRYFRCNQCQTVFFFSGHSVINRLEEGGSWLMTIKKESSEFDVQDLLKDKNTPEE